MYLSSLYRKPTIINGIQIKITSRDMLSKIEMEDLKTVLEKYGYEPYSKGREPEPGYRTVVYVHKDKFGEYDSKGAYWSNTKEMGDHYEVLQDTLEDISIVSGKTVFSIWCEITDTDKEEAMRLLMAATGL